MLTYDYRQRPTAKDILNNKWFKINKEQCKLNKINLSNMNK